MVNAKELSWWKALGIAALGSLKLASMAPAQEAKPVETLIPSYSTRLRTEVDFGENTTFFKNTLGIAPYSAEHNKLNEIFRAYNYTGEKDGEHIDYTSWGGIFPRFKTGNLENEISVFGMDGDNQAIGFQSRHFLNKLIFTTNAETVDQKGENPTRIGAGIDYTYGKFTPGIGIDRVNNTKGITDYFTGKLMVDITKTDLVTMTLRLASGAEEKNRVGGVYMHYGNEETLGTRTRAFYEWNNQTDSREINFESIITQNPAFSKASGTLLAGRGLGESYSLQLYDEILPWKIERVPLGDRSRGGWGLGISGSIKEVAGNESGSIKTEVVHTASLTDKLRRSISGFYRTGIGTNEDRSVGASVLVGKGKNFDLEIGYEHPIQGEKNPAVYFSLMKRF